MDVSDFLEARADEILAAAGAALAARRLQHYERLGSEASARKLRDLLALVIQGARSRDLVPVFEHAERIGNERYDSGFDFVEVQSAMNIVEEAVWRAMLAAYPPAELGQALGLVATLFGAAKDRLASTYLSLATQKHVPTLDLKALFGGT